MVRISRQVRGLWQEVPEWSAGGFDSTLIAAPPGGGKTTLLRCIAGLEMPDSGTVTGVPERLGFVFQEDRLCPQLDAVENVRLVTGRAMSRPDIEAHLRELELADCLHQRAAELSGGQRRRVSIARAVCYVPELLLLDEPFSALDSYLKWDLELKLSDFLENFSGPILWVSHDRGEVFRNCKRVCVLDQGASQGTFTLRQLFHEPETEAAARLSGCKNIVEAVPAGSAVTLPAWGLTLNCGKPVPADICQAGIRARHVMTVPEGTPDAFYCTVERVIQDVFTTIVLLRPEGAASGAPLLRMELERDDWRRLNRPEGLWIAVQPRDILLLK